MELSTTITKTKTASTPYPRAATAWLVVCVLFIAFTVSLIDRQIFSLLFQSIKQTLDISDTKLSLLHGLAFAIFYCAFGIVLGRAVDKYNRRNIIVTGMTLWCMATVACGFSDSFTELFIARMLVGVGEATLSPAALSMIADHFPPERRGRAVGVFSTGVFAGSGLALVLGGTAIDAVSSLNRTALPIIGGLTDWQLAFVVVGAPGLMVAAFIALLKEPERREVSDEGTGLLETLRFFRRNAAALSTMVLAFAANGLINFGLAGWVPTHFIRNYGWTPGEIGTVYGTLLMVCGSAGIICGGFISDRLVSVLGPKGTLLTMRAAALAIIPCLGAFALADTPTTTLIALGFSCFTLGLPTGLAVVALYSITPNQFRGQVIALYLFAVTLIGITLGSTLIALATDYLFADEKAVGKSLALVASCAAIFSFVNLTISQKIQTREKAG